MHYDPWSSGGGCALDPPSLEMTLQLVGDFGWIARLVCRAFVGAAQRMPVGQVDVCIRRKK